MKYSIIDIIATVCLATSILCLGILSTWVGFMMYGYYPTYSEQLIIGWFALIGNLAIVILLGVLVSGYTRFLPYNRRDRRFLD